MARFGILCLVGFVVIYLVYEIFKTKNWFSIKNIILLALLFVYIIPMFSTEVRWSNDEGFLFIIFLLFVGLVISIFIFNTSKLKYINNDSVFKINPKWIKILTGVVLSYYIFQLVMLDIRSINDLIYFMVRDRVGDYLSNPLIERSMVIKPMMETILFILIFYYWKSENKKKGYFLWGLLLVYTTLTSHTRFVILTIALLPFLFHHYYIKKMKTKTVLIMFTGVLLFISVANYARGGRLNSDTFINAITFETVIDQITRASSNSTNSFYRLYYSNIEIEYLKQYLYYLPITFIPRAIWQEKPIVSYFWRATKAITGSYPAGKANPVLTTTIAGEAYHQAGHVGVLFVMLSYTFIILVSLKVLNMFEYTDLIIFRTIIHIPMDMRGGMSTIIVSQFTTLIPLIFLLLLGVYIKRKEKVELIRRISIY